MTKEDPQGAGSALARHWRPLLRDLAREIRVPVREAMRRALRQALRQALDLQKGSEARLDVVTKLSLIHI